MTPNNRIVIIILIVLLGLIGCVTYILHQRYKPVRHTPLSKQSASPSAAPIQSGDTLRKQAELYWQNGDLSNAKTTYQSAYDTYTTEHNAAAAADVKIQIAILDKKISTKPAPPRP